MTVWLEAWLYACMCKSMAGRGINQTGLLGIRRVLAMKWSFGRSCFVIWLKEQKPATSGKASCQLSVTTDKAGWAENVHRWTRSLKDRYLCRRCKGISWHACWRQISGVLFIAPVCMCNASFRILRIGSTDNKGEKKYASIPYSMTGRMSVCYNDKRSRLLAPQEVPLSILRRLSRFKQLPWT